MKEIWKTIDGFNNYLISNQGKVINLKSNNIKKCSKDKIGYIHIILFNRNKRKVFYIHRLVAQAFIPNPDNKPQVNHIDGNKLNNNLINLEWCTHSENMKHAFKSGLHSFKGERNNLSKLSEKQVLAIHGLYLSGMTLITLSKIYNVSMGCIKGIVYGYNWKYLIL